MALYEIIISNNETVKIEADNFVLKHDSNTLFFVKRDRNIACFNFCKCRGFREVEEANISLYDSNSLKEYIDNRSYELRSQLGCIDMGMFTKDIHRVIDKFSYSTIKGEN